MRRGFTLIELIVVIICFVIVFGCLGAFFLIEGLFHFCFGWTTFLWKNLQRMQPSPGAIATGVSCATGFLLGLHALVKRKLNSLPAARWSLRNSAVVTCAIVLLFVAGVSMVSATHQLIWMATSPEPIVESNFEAAPRTASTNNLKQVGQAELNYLNGNKSFTVGGIFDEHGRGLHSWETLLLPYLGRQTLFNNIDLQKSWNDRSHGDLFDTELKLFHNAGHPDYKRRQCGSRSYYALNMHLAGINLSFPHERITDGASQTILAGEILHNPREWGDPVNFRDPALGFEDPNGFGSVWKWGGVSFLLADGTARYVSPDIDPEVLKALSTPNGGDVLSDADF